MASFGVLWWVLNMQLQKEVNSQAVKSVRPQKANVKKMWIKGGSQKWLWLQFNGKNFNNDNTGEFGRRTYKFTLTVNIKNFHWTIVTAISWLPPFHLGLWGRTLFAAWLFLDRFIKYVHYLYICSSIYISGAAFIYLVQHYISGAGFIKYLVHYLYICSSTGFIYLVEDLYIWCRIY